MDLTEAERVIAELKANPRRAHRLLFAHRHENETPDFHGDIIDDLWSDDPAIVMEAFRGAAKTTLAEERLVLGALFRDFPYALVVGNSYHMACKRIEEIAREIIYNEYLTELFGKQKGDTWTTDRIVLANGVCIQAYGRGQSLLGAKHAASRPEFVLCDDIEDEDSVLTEDSRSKVRRWLRGVLMPAMHPTKKRIRVIGTSYHPKGLIQHLIHSPGWKSRVIPIYHFNPDTGEKVATWEARHPLKMVDAMEAEYLAAGNSTEFNQNYLCKPEDQAIKPFQPGMITVIPPPIWHGPTYVFCDPARGGKYRGGTQASRTAYCVWSWSPKLTVHEAFGRYDQPDAIIDTLFKLDREWNPVWVAVEWNGLEEFIGQPLRTEMVKRGHMLPIRAERAPKDKTSFIASLQTLYRAGEVHHVGHLNDLVSELLAFPSGLRDVANALAYAPRLRSGSVVYPDFTRDNIEPELEADERHPLTLAVSSRPNRTGAVLLQSVPGGCHILGDWVREEPPQACVEFIVQEAALLSGNKLRVIIPSEQFDRYAGSGLPAALKRLGRTPLHGAEQLRRQDCLKPILRRQIQGLPAFLVSSSARWTVNALLAGYSRRYNSAGQLDDRPEDNAYALVVEAIESFVAWLAVSGEEDPDGKRYGYTDGGRRYLTSDPRAGNRSQQPLKPG